MWSSPENFTSGEYVVIKKIMEGNSFYMVAVLMGDPILGRPCLCTSLETNQEVLVEIDNNTYMYELL